MSGAGPVWWDTERDRVKIALLAERVKHMRMCDLNWNKISRRGAYGMENGRSSHRPMASYMSYDSNVAHMIVNLKFGPKKKQIRFVCFISLALTSVRQNIV